MLVGRVVFRLPCWASELASLSLHLLIPEDNTVQSLLLVSFHCVVASASSVLQLTQSLQGSSLQSLGRTVHFKPYPPEAAGQPVVA